jgi:uncharacterized membrane protein
VSFIFTIIGLMISLDVIWWIVLARLANHGIGRFVISIFMLAMMVGLIGVIAARMYRGNWDRFIPKFAVSAIFIWHFIGLGLLSLVALALLPILLGQKIVRIARNSPSTTTRSVEAPVWSRRDGSTQQRPRPPLCPADLGAAEGIGWNDHRAGERHACGTVHQRQGAAENGERGQ